MTAVLWCALGLALVLLPGTSPAAIRTDTLAERGRLSVGSPRRARQRTAMRAKSVAALGCLIATMIVTAAGGAVLGLSAAIASSTAARLVLVTIRAATIRRGEAELLTSLRLLAAELDAGGQPSAAFEAAAEACFQHRSTFLDAAQACRRGDDPLLDTPALVGLGQAWRVAVVTGAPIAAVVGRVADDLAGQVEQRRTVTATVAGPRSSAAMLAGLPVLGLLLGAAMQAHPLDVLFGSPAGRLLCLAGVALDAAGLLWTQRLTARAEQQ